ncbi:MAG: hypothetical protein L3V56_13075 [Candidatus Magnetoovum sp. WYHC-5]|nr:hypothetical protein [Candidatus Magnetoovum sp. WYHC-5]
MAIIAISAIESSGSVAKGIEHTMNAPFMAVEKAIDSAPRREGAPPWRLTSDEVRAANRKKKEALSQLPLKEDIDKIKDLDGIKAVLKTLIELIRECAYALR